MFDVKPLLHATDITLFHCEADLGQLIVICLAPMM